MLLDYLCVEKCRGCGQFVSPRRDGPVSVCLSCWPEPARTGPSLERLTIEADLAGQRRFVPIASGTTYSGILKKLIYRLKYDKDKVVVTDLAPLIGKAYDLLRQDVLPSGQKPLLVPVPLHWTRLVTRGYNQSELLADEVAARFDVELDTRLLSRRRITKAQHDLNKEQRRHNIVGAFRVCRWAGKEPAPIVLVDDVYTSGATLSEAAKLLLAHGFHQVFAVTAARAIFEDN